MGSHSLVIGLSNSSPRDNFMGSGKEFVLARISKMGLLKYNRLSKLVSTCDIEITIFSRKNKSEDQKKGYSLFIRQKLAFKLQSMIFLFSHDFLEKIISSTVIVSSETCQIIY